MSAIDNARPSPAAAGPLAGVRVLDLGRILAAPWATQLLADMGAEVIKVERPGKGDDSRQFGPPFLRGADGRNTSESTFYASANRNKQSIACDISHPEGQRVVRDLLNHCDVLVENYKVGDLKRYGLDYEALRQDHPALIYCSITGFGQTGPYRARPGYDAIFQAMGGLMSITGHPDGTPGGGPMKVGPSVADILCGHYAAYAILSALYHRDAHGGGGQHIDLALLDSVIASTSHYASHFLNSGDVPVRRGTEGNGGMPSRLFCCRDGDVMVVAGNNEQFGRLCRALGHPGLAGDPRFATNADRVSNRRELAEVFEPLFAAWSSDELLRTLDAAGVPAGRINDLRQVFEDPQVQARGMCVEAARTSAGAAVRFVANPVKLSATPLARYDPPPAAGEHTDRVLRGLLAYSSERIDALRAQQIV